MSPYILIDKALEGLSDPNCPDLLEVLVMKQITAHFTNESITAEEFNHYCERLNRAVASRPRRSA